MKISESFEVGASLDKVWEALNDPEIIRQCIPLCESFEKTGENAYEATASVDCGLVKGTYKGNITVDVSEAPNKYMITGECDGGVVGSAKGIGRFELTELAPDRTHVFYRIDAKAGGSLAEMGQRNVYAAGKWVARRFRSKFIPLVAPGDSSDDVAKANNAPEAYSGRKSSRPRPIVLVGLAVAAACMVWIVISL